MEGVVHHYLSNAGGFMYESRLRRIEEVMEREGLLKKKVFESVILFGKTDDEAEQEIKRREEKIKAEHGPDVEIDFVIVRVHRPKVLSKPVQDEV